MSPRALRRSDGIGVLDAGPSLRAITFGPGPSEPTPLLSPRQQQQLAGIATRLTLPPRMTLFREDSPANWVFIIADGVIKSFRDSPAGRRRVVAFLFAHDMCGLAERGLYVNTAQTITPATLYRIRLDALSDTLRADADLDMQFLCKVTHELRKTLRQSFLVTRRDAVGRYVMFLRMLEQHRSNGGGPLISIPMSRTDTANYLALSLESVSRAARSLEKQGIVRFEGVHAAHVLDRDRFERVAAAH